MKVLSGACAYLAITLTITLSTCIAAAAETPEAMNDPLPLRASSAEVGRYEPIEFSMGPVGGERNPDDPDPVDLRLEVETPMGRRIEIPGFAYQAYERKVLGEGSGSREWVYPSGPAEWRARMAPLDCGPHVARARLRSARGTRISEPVRFTAIPGSSRGFIRVSRRDPRFFEYSNGEPFFAVGQNLAFIGEGQYVTPRKAEEIIAKLAANGANYLRIWACCEDWALAIEARKSAWGRSWSGTSPVVDAPWADSPQGGSEASGKEAAPPRRVVKLSASARASIEVSPSHSVALRPSTRYQLRGSVRIEGESVLRVEFARGEPREAARGEPAKPPERGKTTGGTAGTIAPERSPPLPHDFAMEFDTAADQYALGTLRLRLEGPGPAWIESLSLSEANGGPELLAEADPNRPILGVYDPLDAFFLDGIVEAARRSGVRLQLCLLTRDLYMPHLRDPESEEYRSATRSATKLLRYASARWGHSTAVASWEYFNELDPGLRIERFLEECGRSLDEADPHRHLRATSTWHPRPADWRHPSLDAADMHWYLRPEDEPRLQDEIAGVLDRASFLRAGAPDRPALLSEFGIATSDWKLRDEARRDTKLIHLHNALWASALSGLSGTVLSWWWESLDERDVYPVYRPLAAFAAGIPWTTARLESASAETSPETLHAVIQRGKDGAWGWVADRSAAWIGSGAKGIEPTPIRGAAITLRGLAPGSWTVAWWHTREGRVEREDQVECPSGTLHLRTPDFLRDVAFSARRKS